MFPRQHYCDDSFFDDIDSETKAYWLGFIATDGYVIGPTLSIALAAADVGHLAKWRAAIAATNPVHVYESTHRYARISIRSKRLVAGLARYFISERKTFTVRPAAIPPEFVRHYWRGAFDGDGCLDRGSLGWRVRFFGNQQMVSGFADFLRSTVPIVARILPHRSIFEVGTSGNRIVPLVLWKLYGQATISLDRKASLVLAAIADGHPLELVEWNGARYRVADLARAVGLKKGTLAARLHTGWTVERAVSTPPDLYHRGNHHHHGDRPRNRSRLLP